MDDTISRQAAIDAIGEKSDEIYKTKQKGATYPHDDFFQGMAYAENIVKQLPSSHPEQRWIPCSEKLPEEPFGCLVTVWDTNPVTMDEFENILPYFVGWDGEQWNDGDGEQCPFEVIAWMPLPTPYREE